MIKIFTREPQFLLKIYRLTRNVNKDHLNEIFSAYGGIVKIDLPIDLQSKNHKGIATIQLLFLYLDTKIKKKVLKQKNI